MRVERVISVEEHVGALVQTTVDSDFSAPYTIFGTVGQIKVVSNSLYF